MVTTVSSWLIQILYPDELYHTFRMTTQYYQYSRQKISL